MLADIVQIKLSSAQALVLFELLTRLDETNSIPLDHPSEQKLLWLLEGQLEKQVPILFAPNYKQLVAEAREEVGSL
jgi:hypothetical protein